MWIDIFPKKARLPDPVDITPRELKTSISQISGISCYKDIGTGYLVHALVLSG